MTPFVFENYQFDRETLTATFNYRFDKNHSFQEKVTYLKRSVEYDVELLEKSLFLAFLLIGTSYYKTFPSRQVVFEDHQIDGWQTDFLNKVYQEGMSQFAFENNLSRDDLAHFAETSEKVTKAKNYDGQGILALQSGGKDSLLTAAILKENNHIFSSFYISSTEFYPDVLNEIHSDITLAKRQIDLPAIKKASNQAGRNGHVPVTYIVQAIALVQAILLNKKTILTSIGHEGEEVHTKIGDLPVNHQWAKTWSAEQKFADYVKKYISPDIEVGSPLRLCSELKITELFVKYAWEKFGHKFSSCNLANYEQGADNTTLKWDGTCPKCANSFLLFAPFVEPSQLKSLFDGQDLFAKPSLQNTFKGLLGVDDVMKPFECVGEVAELRCAYHKSQEKGGYASLPFSVPKSDFNCETKYPAQNWAGQLLNT